MKLTPKELKALETLLDDLETGWIANPTRRAEANRNRIEKVIRAILARAKGEQ